ncbi:aminotransferase class V-fold PLP-dependent enzyme [Hydrogenimonas thermophila]|uniref:aminotransferase class V-fold PLP-dependent enzyme n=1 Tax=Hydrogenimonas thermophila TaxID=223786 RepID=UPI0029373D19|nr:aminotransferase class V-fold PLP-dependent enzyme [Hydrogenimonas thermophila]WOE71138.1 aminotransferase class V-fold PLP-dependent enzyme [Hydrogenimonas thermophila]WOE73656.1 aminotransferase class V-fold PLP-dependent enzyme [Hydrogenimonas thermophila]
MNQKLFQPLLKSKDTRQELFDNTIGKRKSTYFDFTATGLGYHTIEERMAEVLQYYANTHSEEAYLAKTMQECYENARSSLKRSLDLEDDFLIIPSGYGSTGAIKRFQELMGLYIPPAVCKRLGSKPDVPKKPLVVVGPYEHHSNELGFRESLCDIHRVPLTADGKVDLQNLENVLKKNRGREIIGSFCVASNATGIITPYEEISKLLRHYGSVVCFDAAATSPYMNIPSHLFDAMFLSAHKLIGGPGACGLLVIRKDLVDTSIAPTYPGGGTVTYVSRTSHMFHKNPEIREDAGTPAVLQMIRAALAYQLRNEMGLTWIKERKEKLYRYLVQHTKKSDQFQILGNPEAENIGIVSLIPKQMSPYALCQVLSEKFQIETRAGCACAGPYGHDLLGLEDDRDLSFKPGWLRISLHPIHTFEQIDHLVDALHKITNTKDLQ